ncbi:MAG: antibiotic resistance protein VanZ [Roseovarius sp.]|nr:antibiotic resistance protein VanZ [Roseovarius sp.]|tara:strand:- start:949 stop:1299 length:351 start_codon:yes stop_codon:yes gene_type:complete
MAIFTSLLLAVAVAVFTLGPAVPGPELLSLSDKAKHAIAFAAVACPLAWRFPRFWHAVALGVLAYGGMIEILQPLTGRDAEWGDFLADGIGALVGVFLGMRLRGLWPGPERRPSNG